jgi:hypothetical protein
MGSGANQAGQREPSEWLGTTVRTLGAGAPGDLLPPRHHTWSVAWGGRGGLAQECPPAARRPCLVPVGEAARVPEPPEAAGAPLQADTAAQGVGVARPGRSPMALTTLPGGTAAPPLPPIKAPGGRDGESGRHHPRGEQGPSTTPGWAGRLSRRRAVRAAAGSRVRGRDPAALCPVRRGAAGEHCRSPCAAAGRLHGPAGPRHTWSAGGRSAEDASPACTGAGVPRCSRPGEGVRAPSGAGGGGGGPPSPGAG